MTMLSGKQHTVFTGVVIKTPTNISKFYEHTKVLMAKMDQRTIQAYIATNEPMTICQEAVHLRVEDRERERKELKKSTERVFHCPGIGFSPGWNFEGIRQEHTVFKVLVEVL
ncbi:hypothetical protein J6590_071215 [Homalodisca vitripennis]|nr:hypothetical protein J6590_071215 [Homalodisca vitripennis]